MVNNIENIVLEHLRHIRTSLDRMRDDIEILSLRIGSVEHILKGHPVTEAVQDIEFDRLRLRVDRIERRLQLSETGGS